jgi:hypothetical protein
MVVFINHSTRRLRIVLYINGVNDVVENVAGK